MFWFDMLLLKLYRFRKKNYLEATIDCVALIGSLFIPVMVFIVYYDILGYPPIENIVFIFWTGFLFVVLLFLNIYYKKVFLHKLKEYNAISSKSKEMKVVETFIVFVFASFLSYLIYSAWINGEFDFLFNN